MKVKLYALVILCIFVLTIQFSFAQTANPSDLEKEIEDLKQKIAQSQSQQRTLNNEITGMDNKIKLLTLQVNETTGKIRRLGEEIDQLNQKIDNLEKTLSHLSKLLINRIVAAYKIQRLSYATLLFSANGLSDFLNRTKYIQLAQTHDRQVMTQVQLTKINFSEQKELREKKKIEQEELKKKLETQKKNLDSQKAAKQTLLKQTKNDETTYQKLLSAALSEYLAIQAILAGIGEETQVGKVNEGQVIANVIEGSSCNSSGTHLHFIVRENVLSKNPFNYLKGGIEFENCSGSSCASSDGDPFNPSGDWNWPLEPIITMSQGYGSTWAVKYTWVGQIYNFHNGIDISGSTLSVRAVKSGKLYRGSYQGSNCRLRYVRVDHDDSELDTLYLHVNYSQ